MRHFVLIIGLCLLTGCAQWNFHEGSSLIDNGEFDEGLTRLQKAVVLDPNNTKYRAYYYRQRELAVQRVVAQGDAARQRGQEDVAEKDYDAAAKLDPTSSLPTIALNVLHAEQRHRDALRNAGAAFKEGRLDEAQTMAHSVLAEDLQNRDAQNLLRKIEEAEFSAQTEPQLNASLQRPITVEFRDTDLKSIFELLSRNTGINFFFDKDVRPDLRTTVFVRDTSIDDVIRFVLTTNQLQRKVLNGNTILIYPDTDAKNGQYQDLITKSFYLSHADVKQTANMIKTLVKTKDLFTDDNLRLLIMRDKPNAIRMAEKLIAAQDIAPAEVMLEVEVLEVASTLLTNLGIDYPTSISGSIIAPAAAATTAGTLTLNQWKNLNSGFYSLAVGDPALVLNLKDQLTDSNTLANPRIRVKDGEKASIHIGDKVPIITTTVNSTNFASESVNYLDVGLKLDVEPTISLANEVEIKVDLEVSNILSQITTNSGSVAYTLGTRDASTVLHLKDGETQILAGLISKDDQKTADRIPGLGELPILGRLFSNHNNSKTKTEIVLLITPRILRTVERPDVNMTEFLSGTENVIGAPSLQLHLTPPTPTEAAPSTAPQVPATPTPPAESTATPQPSPAASTVDNALKPSLPPSGKLTLEAPSQQITIGEEFTVMVNLASQTPLQAGSFALAFDPARFKVSKVEPAELLTGSGTPSFQYNVQNAAGRLSVSYAATGEIKGQGTLAKITFQATGPYPGTTIISMAPPSTQDSTGKDVALTTPIPLALSLSR